MNASKTRLHGIYFSQYKDSSLRTSSAAQGVHVVFDHFLLCRTQAGHWSLLAWKTSICLNCCQSLFKRRAVILQMANCRTISYFYKATFNLWKKKAWEKKDRWPMAAQDCIFFHFQLGLSRCLWFRDIERWFSHRRNVYAPRYSFPAIRCPFFIIPVQGGQKEEKFRDWCGKATHGSFQHHMPVPPNYLAR